jgi:hypothetical protein
MWPFKRKKDNIENKVFVIQCPDCKSSHIRIKGNDGKVWRGDRYLSCRCLNCGRDFYAEEPAGWSSDYLLEEEELIDNEDELLAAEEELRREAEENDDRTCW